LFNKLGTLRPRAAESVANRLLEEALLLIRAELRHRGGHRERNAQIYRDRLAGRTLKSLAIEHGLTDERIRQLCNLAAARRVASRWSGRRMIR
jgi:hypothetical protein